MSLSAHLQWDCARALVLEYHMDRKLGFAGFPGYVQGWT